MRIQQLANAIGAQILVADRNPDIDLDQVFAGDRISDLLNAAADHQLLVTNLASGQLLRMTDLMEIPALCLVGGQMPDNMVLEVARDQNMALMVSPEGLFETCGRMHRVLSAEGHS